MHGKTPRMRAARGAPLHLAKSNTLPLESPPAAGRLLLSKPKALPRHSGSGPTDTLMKPSRLNPHV